MLMKSALSWVPSLRYPKPEARCCVLHQVLLSVSAVVGCIAQAPGPVPLCGAYEAAHGLALLLASLGFSLFFFSADNPENLTSQMNTFGILFTAAILAFLTGASTMYCYFWHRRGQASRQDRQDPENEIALCQQDPPLLSHTAAT